MKQKIIDYLEAHRGQIIEDIAGLVRFESVAGNPAETEKALDFVLGRAKEMGFRTMTTSQKDVGIIETGQGKETVGILAHVDVVGVGDPEKWTWPPYDCVARDGFLLGRGTIDDKGPVIMSLYALKALVDLNIPLRKKIQLIVGTCEETQWTDMEHFKEQFPLPDYGFSPDGEFPIYNAEKGYADVELLFDEPNFKQILELQSGDSPNTIPSKAVIRFPGGPLTTFNGVSAHSSEPESGDNAIEKLCRSLAGRDEFHFIRFINDILAGDPFAGALAIDAGTGDIDLEPTTAAPTILKLTGSAVFLNVNIRQKVGVKMGDITRAFDRLAETYSFTFHITECEDGMMVDESLEALQRMKQAANAFDCDGSFQLARGSSYAKTMDNFVSWGPVFPGETNMCHMENERISIETMMLATKIYTLYLALEARGE